MRIDRPFQRLRRLSVLPAAVLVLLLSACSTVSGQAVPAGGNAPRAGSGETTRSDTTESFYARFGSQTAARAQERAAAQQLDPCGYLDLPTVTKLGKQIALGPGSTLDSCDIILVDPDTNRLRYGFRIRTGNLDDPVFASDTDHDVRAHFPELSVDGKQLPVAEYSSYCLALFPSVQGTTFNFQFTALQNDVPHPCDFARDALDATLRLVQTHPQRRDSPARNPFRLSTVDPCLAFAALHEVESVDAMDTTFCRANRGDGQPHEIKFEIDETSQADPADPTADTIDVVGKTALELRTVRGDTDKLMCQVVVFMDTDHPEHTMTIDGPQERSGAIVVTTPSCPESRTLAVRAVHLAGT
ncbi:hypothetical protein [Speluncibacter jeojiensis]|uniref:DUF3558 domain-containing protein n=1 Tax=Speluncibacter jeojiensis TaxID=2710754 RepID=A0A9X4RDX6_9ACTN|nr:hypothetical protein [Corynebacteriales bacterium D3-21]